MADPQVSAPSCAPFPVPGPGVVHVRTRHADRFTVVGNHLAQHRGLTLTAIGLAVHIQSLPDGARVDIRSVAARFPEGETRIASALRELEAHGYLSRTRERLPSGRVVTRTVAYDRPPGGERARGGPPPRRATAAGARRPRTATVEAPRPWTGIAQGTVRPVRGSTAPGPVPPAAQHAGQHDEPPAAPDDEATPVPDHRTPHPPDRAPNSSPDLRSSPHPPVRTAGPRVHSPDVGPGHAPHSTPDRAAHRVPPALPAPRTADPQRHRTAALLLADLRRHDERLLLTEPDVRRLAGAVAAWLERGVSPDAVRRALTSNLPEAPRHPAALLAHRLTVLLPPPLPATGRPAELRPPPLQNCDGCDRAFRSPAPGHCPGCRTTAARGPERAA